MNVEEFATIKHKIAVDLRKNQSLLDLIFDEVDCAPEEEDVAKRICMFNFVPDVTVDTSTYLCIDTEIVSIQNVTVLDTDIYYWILVHKDNMELRDEFKIPELDLGDRRDYMAIYINRFMNGKYDLGKGRCEMKPTKLMSFGDKYVGRRLTYTVHETNRVGYPK